MLLVAKLAKVALPVDLKPKMDEAALPVDLKPKMAKATLPVDLMLPVLENPCVCLLLNLTSEWIFQSPLKIAEFFPNILSI